MQFFYLLTALTATGVLAAPSPAEPDANVDAAGAAAAGLAPQACLPASCASFGVCTFLCNPEMKEQKRHQLTTHNSLVLLRKLRILVCK